MKLSKSWESMKMKNSTIEEIAIILIKAKKVLIFPHLNMDGDALGSSVALCIALRNAGKEAFVLIEDEVPGNIKFLDKGYCTMNQHIIEDADVSVCLDCGDESRIEGRIEKFKKAPSSVCMDHHMTTEPFCAYNYIDPKAAATGQIVYDLIKTMGIPISKEIGEALYTAIVTDTGRFQYSNTTSRTHMIAADLYEAGIDGNAISIEIYENMPLRRLKIKNSSINTMAIFADDKAAIAYVTGEMLRASGATMDETDGIVEEIRCIDTVQIAGLLKEYAPDEIKVSLRVKKEGNVAEIASKYGGGGHKKAAGFTLKCSLSEAFDIVKEEIIENLEKYDK